MSAKVLPDPSSMTNEQIEAEMTKLKPRVEKLRIALEPLANRLRALENQLTKRLAGRIGGRAPRKRKYDYDAILQTYDQYRKDYGYRAHQRTAETCGIPLRTLSNIIAWRRKSQR